MPRAPAKPATAITHVALLRGINVGGKHSLPMKRLSAIFEQAGARNVRTYIQSGNVVFSASDAAAARVVAGVRKAIEDELALRVPVVLRKGSELLAVAKHNPFLREGADSKILHVAFLEQAGSAQARSALDPGRSPPDRFALRDRELYLCCPNGMARTKLTSAYLDRALGTVTTVRNWNTVLALCELARG
jgi:uncharacterized protein (DUF1697 family)